MTKLLFYFQVFCISLLIATIYWFFETCIHTYVFHSGIFISRILPNDSNELWMRIFTAMLFIVSTFIFSCFLQKKTVLSKKLRLCVEALHIMREGCVITNHLNEIVYVNSRYEQLSGYKLNEIKGKNPSILSSGKQDKSFYKKLWLTLSQKGYWEGELWNRKKSGELYMEWVHISVIRDEKGKAVYYVGVFNDITSQKKMEEQITHYAYHDPLVNLPNRRLFVELLQQAAKLANRKKEKIAILFLDLDKFKLINDQFGHSVGDQFLCEVAKRICQAVRESDIVSRFGGDEFLIALLNIQSKENAVLLANKILSDFDECDVEINSHCFKIKASIGGAVYPDDLDDVKTLIQYADQAMYRVKKQNGHNVCFYEQQ